MARHGWAWLGMAELVLARRSEARHGAAWLGRARQGKVLFDMHPLSTEVTATWLGHRIRWESGVGIGLAVIDGQEVETKGPIDDDMAPHATYRMHGRWGEYRNPKSGKCCTQFHYDSAVRTSPTGKAGVVAYLIEANRNMHGLGKARAEKAWELWGSDAVEFIRENPAEAAKSLSLKLDGAQAIADWLSERQHLERTSIDLAAMLEGRGFRKTLARMVLRRWKARAAEAIQRDPYRLMEFPGCGFKLCDNLYLSLGKDPNKLRRQAYAFWHAIAEASDQGGHSWLPLSAVEQLHAASVPQPRARAARRMAQRLGMIATCESATGDVIDRSGSLWIAESKHAAAEEAIANRVATAGVPLWGSVEDLDGITDHQRAELRKALLGQIGILAGGGGTGKSWTIAKLLPHLIAKFGENSIGIAAPTGKAAVRVTEYLQANGIDKRAKTWHSLLGVAQHDADTGGWSFEHHAGNPWTYKVIIGDESSMIDASLMAAICRAMPAECHLLLLGDTQQLPPVGVGAPMRDLIAAGVPCGELTQTHRNSGGILESCTAIRNGKSWRPGDNLHVTDSPPELDDLPRIIAGWAAKGFDPVWDVQPIVAVNEKSILSRKAANELLAAELNPNGGRVAGGKFRQGDKVVCLQNCLYEVLESDAEEADEAHGGKAYVANGEIGKVLESHDGRFVVELSSPRRVVVVPLGMGSWDLGYALSCHKSQGAQWPVVLVVLDESPAARRICERSWLYTAISRAERHCVLIGRKEIADGFCRRQSIEGRKTFLKQLILAKQAEMELVEM